MKKGKHTEEQIIDVLKQVEVGRTVKELARELGVSGATIYMWKSKFGGMEVSEARRLKELEDENRRLKHMVADLSLDKEALKAVIRKKRMGIVGRRQDVALLMSEFHYSEREACKLLAMDRSSYRYRPRPDHNAELRRELIALARQKSRFGYRRLCALLERRGCRASPQRVYRVYSQKHLAVRRLKRKRLVRPARGLRRLTVVDSFTRECPAIEVDTGLSSRRVTRVLEWIISQRGTPEVIRCDYGPKFTSRHFLVWCEERESV